MGRCHKRWQKHKLSCCSSQVKTKTECGSYRPISLLNSDVKILAKDLDLRLETTMHVISADQTGFISRRHSFRNIRRLLKIIYSSASSRKPVVGISFERIEWENVCACLKHFRYGPNSISGIQLLYTSPKVSVVTNGQLNPYVLVMPCPDNLLVCDLSKTIGGTQYWFRTHCSSSHTWYHR